MKNKFSTFSSLFFLGFILFFPLPFFGNFQSSITSFLFGNLIQFIANQFFGINDIMVDFSSDSTSMYILVAILLMVSLVLTFLIKERHNEELIIVSKKILVFYLAIVLLKYGFDKIFKAQFYLPEPNILYTRFGNLDKDILYWSTMGTSRTYSLILGNTEVLCAILLVFRKTRTLGLVFSAIVFLQIIFVNLGFDISVKLFSLILLLISIFVLEKEIPQFYRFFVLRQNVQLAEEKPFLKPKFRPLFLSLKILVIGFALVKILYNPLFSGNLNDDESERPFLHGAFKNFDEKSDIEYLFFHRNQYFILMNKNDDTFDYHYKKIDAENYIIENETEKQIHAKINFNKKDSIITVKFGENKIVAKQQNWQRMNAMKPQFHFTVEEVK